MRKGILFGIICLFCATIHAQGTINMSKNSTAVETEIKKGKTVQVSAQLVSSEDYMLMQKKEKSAVFLAKEDVQTKKLQMTAQAKCITPDEKETYQSPKREVVHLSPEKETTAKKTQTVIVPPVALLPKN